MVPVGHPNQPASGSFTVKASIDTGPLFGNVKQTLNINLPEQKRYEQKR